MEYIILESDTYFKRLVSSEWLYLSNRTLEWEQFVVNREMIEILDNRYIKDLRESKLKRILQ